jgi:lipopolysaccharide export LptBFGC system permease protein LptF
MNKSILILWIFVITQLHAQIERWIYTYNGVGNNADEANSIVYGSDNNLYSAGISFGLTGDNDFAVVSIDTAGNYRWAYTYDGQGHVTDGANDIVYGDDGNVYAAGWCNAGTGDIDICVAGVDTAGNEQWVYRYNGTANYVDNAFSIDRGVDGNIYAAGFTFTFASGVTDFIVISLTSAGSERWIYKYDGGGNPWNGANAIVYGPDNYIYAAGYCGGTSNDVDLAVVCLDTAGNEEWIYKYNGPGNDDDEAMAILYGDDNNLYVAGYSGGSGSDDDFVVVSLTTSGGENWVYRYNGTGNSADQANDIAYGNDDLIYAAGFAYNTDADNDFTIVSLTLEGSERWVYTYNGPYSFTDEALSIDCGSDSNVYASGHSFGDGTREDFTVVGLDSNGDELAVYRYDGTRSIMDKANSIVYGPDDYVYAAGMSFNNNTVVDLTVISLDPSAMGIRDNNQHIIDDTNYYLVTHVKGALPVPTGVSYKIFDITGREIRTLNPSPGIYFIEIQGKTTYKVLKVR